jgi:hypothetical protein
MIVEMRRIGVKTAPIAGRINQPRIPLRCWFFKLDAEGDEPLVSGESI